MSDQCDLQINVNGQQTFFLNQETVSTFSKKLRKMIKQEKKITQMKNVGFIIQDFPGGSNGFELVARFCYNFGVIHITVDNVSNLYCASLYLGMTHKIPSFNLVHQVDSFLEGMFDWSWSDVLISIRNCQPFFHYADSSGLVDKLITCLLAKIAQNSDISLILSSYSSSSSSPESTMAVTSNPFARSNSSVKTTPDKIKRLSSTSNHSSITNNNKAWWFDDLSTFSPWVIEKVIRSLGAYGSDNNSLLLTKFLLHYLKIAVQTKKTTLINYPKSDYSGLVDTAIYGVILMGKTAFSCRALFGVLRLVSGFGVSKVCRSGLEKLIGSMLDLAKLDDLLMSAQTDNESHDQGVYDVNLVVGLIRVFVQCEGLSLERLIKVGRLVDQYLAEIAPDHNLKISKFIRVAQSLPDLARDCFDGVYRAIDIYLESHPNLSFEERSRLCRCLNYEKLSLEACKELAKNPRIPPRVAVEALASQKQVNYEQPTKADQLDYYYHQSPIKNTRDSQMVLYGNQEYIQDEDEHEEEEDEDTLSEVSQDVKVNIQRMQCRVLELEKMCKEMKSQMSKLVRNNSTKTLNSPTTNRPHRLC